jgi:hypothetical protein
MTSLRIALTLDMDWAPDCTIDEAAALLVAAGVRATWFVTHDSPAVRRLRLRADLFELGIHPNFLPGSTQGRTPEEVLHFCMGVVPEAQAVKTHALVESTHLLEAVLEHTPIRADLTTLLPGVCLATPARYEWKRKVLWRLPCAWEDNFQFDALRPEWCLADMPWLKNGGVAAFTFHPLTVALNSSSIGSIEKLKAEGPLPVTRPERIRELHETRTGVGTVFRELVDFAARENNSIRVRDVTPCQE